ncbi:MAG: hypothetical protein ACPG73_03920 [Candidatus Poseidoniaceae archaeon]
MSTWFREISVIDAENLPSDRGAIIVSWHPGGLFDNMLTKGLLPGEQVKFDGFINDKNELESIAKQVASGKNVVVFPEGESHSSPKSKEIQDNAARIALKSAELSPDNPPVIIPVGIHYSKKHLFRERVALTVERPIEIEGDVESLSKVISGEISRSSLSREDWKDRELIWKARSIIHAERLRKNPELADVATYGEGVIGARRVRAAWEWMSINNQEKCRDLENRTRSHMERLEFLDLKPHHVDDRPQSVTTYGFLRSIFLWLFAWSFMLGFVTFSAIVGSFPPFLFVVSIDRIFGPKMEDSKRGALKLYTALVAYPIWWSISAYAFTWALLSDSSPLAGLADYSVVIQFLFSLPAILVLPLMLWWMPTAGKLQMKLYSKGKSSWRRMRLWSKWRDSSLDWDELCTTQQKLASDLVQIGDGLILPGDLDWKSPAPGEEDYTSVAQR